MSDSEETIYPGLLLELKRFEQAVEQQRIEGIEEWKEKVKIALKGAYRIRFSNLKFYEEEPDLDPGIPF